MLLIAIFISGTQFVYSHIYYINNTIIKVGIYTYKRYKKIRTNYAKNAFYDINFIVNTIYKQFQHNDTLHIY